MALLDQIRAILGNQQTSPQGNVVFDGRPIPRGGFRPEEEEEEQLDPVIARRAQQFGLGGRRAGPRREGGGGSDQRSLNERFTDTVPSITGLTGQPGVAKQAADFQQSLREEALSLALSRAQDIRRFGAGAARQEARLATSKLGQGGFKPNVDPKQGEGEKVALALQTLERFDQASADPRSPGKVRRRKAAATGGVGETPESGLDITDKKELAVLQKGIQGEIKSNILPGGGARFGDDQLNERILRNFVRPFLSQNPGLREQFSGPFGERQLLDFLAGRQ